MQTQKSTMVGQRRKRIKPDKEAEIYIRKQEDKQGFVVKEIPLKGRGVVTTEEFDNGDFLLQYPGKLLPESVAEALEEDEGHPSVFRYFFSFKGKTKNRNRKDSGLKDALESSFKASRERDRAYMEEERNHRREEMRLRQDETGLRDMASMFHAFDRPTYLRPIPSHLNELLNMPTSMLNHLKGGGFTVSVTGAMGESLGADESHETLINRQIKMALQVADPQLMDRPTLYLPYRAMGQQNLSNQVFSAPSHKPNQCEPQREAIIKLYMDTLQDTAVTRNGPRDATLHTLMGIQPADEVQRKDLSELVDSNIKLAGADVGREGEDDVSQFKMTVEDQIVDFFEAHPCFYAKDDGDYKNRDKKNRLLEDFVKELGHGYTAINKDPDEVYIQQDKLRNNSEHDDNFPEHSNNSEHDINLPENSDDSDPDNADPDNDELNDDPPDDDPDSDIDGDEHPPDAPARSTMQNTIGFNGYSGCSLCYHPDAPADQQCKTPYDLMDTVDVASATIRRVHEDIDGSMQTLDDCAGSAPQTVNKDTDESSLVEEKQVLQEAVLAPTGTDTATDAATDTDAKEVKQAQGEGTEQTQSVQGPDPVPYEHAVYPPPTGGGPARPIASSKAERQQGRSSSQPASSPAEPTAEYRLRPDNHYPPRESPPGGQVDYRSQGRRDWCCNYARVASIRRLV
eukprot:XP_011673727.1 PREDICTED: uncharacterized protein LOC105442823 [Strongylocentrotus purpuratus]